MSYCFSLSQEFVSVHVSRSELALLQNLLHGFSKRYLSITTGQALPGEKVKSCCVTPFNPLTFNLSKSPTSSTYSYLKKVWVYCGGATLIIGVTLPRALWSVSSGALPQVLEGHAPKTAPDLEVVGEQENLPALLQFSLDLNSRTKNNGPHSPISS